MDSAPRNKKTALEGGSSSLETRHGDRYAVLVNKHIKPKQLLELDGGRPTEAACYVPIGEEPPLVLTDANGEIEP